MSKTIITVENLSKSYLVGHESVEREGYTTLRDLIVREARNFARKATDVLHGRQIVEGDEVEEFWALKNVSFQVKEGEVLGIIGRNGAGKSTLLKVLSRVTEPSQGRVLLRGRVASLLEVGTGFHPELTGRENVYLNGAILGMNRTEIERKFDEIVAFAGVEKFIDTPVKRYSSGMYIRLGFAVAAHLDPEILVVDEVLAVGDAEFQKKCLGRMRSVATQENRTVLFVSHNLQAIRLLCNRAIFLDSGRLEAEGEAQSVVARYLAQTGPSSHRERVWSEHDAPGDSECKLTAVRVLPQECEPGGNLSSKHDLCIELEFISHRDNPRLCVGFDLADADGTVLFRTYQTDLPADRWPVIRRGRNRWQCTIPKGLLNGGEYVVSPRISTHNVSWTVNGDPVLQFRLALDHGSSPLWAALTEASRPGMIAPILQWQPADRIESAIVSHSRAVS
jgi:lipopolysaccharide transport system ATP-binding protein